MKPMPKLPVIPPEKLSKALEEKGFVLDRINGSHHIYIHPETNVTIVIPFHKKEMKKGLLLEAMKQAGITKEELIDFL